MAQIDIITTIKGGAGKVTVTKAGIDDIEIESSGTSQITLSAGDHFLMVGAEPPSGGTIEVKFEQSGTNLGSHTYKKAGTVSFQLEVS